MKLSVAAVYFAPFDDLLTPVVNKGSSILYFFLKNYFKIGIRLFFWKVKVVGKENIPLKGPLIFAVNHQNTFLDAIVVTCSTDRNPFFLTRGDVFKHPVVSWFLQSIRMLPIYRRRDGIGNLRQNQNTFSTCETLMLENKSLIIFPEGAQECTWRLRPLQKGLARIAWQAIEKSGGDVIIIPVGLQYAVHRHSGGRLLIQFGKKISAKELIDSQQHNESTSLQLITETVENAMRPLILNIPSNDYETKKENFLKSRHFEQDLNIQLQHDQLLVDGSAPIGKSKNHFLKYFVFPIQLIGFLLCGIPVFLLKRLIQVLLKDSEFWGAAKFAGGMIFLPFWSIAIFVSTFCIYGSIWLSIVVLLISWLGLHFYLRKSRYF